MLRILLLLALCGFSTYLFAQEYDAPFGELSETDILKALNMKTYARDSSASAVVLYEQGSVDRTSERTRIIHLRRVKIFKNEAIEEWSNMFRRIDTRGTHKVRGVVYFLVDGRIGKQELTDANIFKKFDRHGLEELHTAMPGVAPGAIVEYEFQSTLTQFYTYPDWTFQHNIPSIKSEFYVSGKFALNFDAGGSEKPQYSYDKLRGIHHWYLRNLPAFHEEPFMPDTHLYRASLNSFYITQPWPDQVPDFWRSSQGGLLIVGKPSWGKLADRAVGDVTDPKMKVKKIVEYVKSQMVWSKSDGIWAHEDIDERIDKKRGSSADINLFLTSLLNKADLEVNPVLISTRDNGAYHEHYPTLEQFNYIVAQVAIGKDTLYVDATDPALAYDMLPTRCLNGRGLMVLKKDAKWINIVPKAKSRFVTESTMSVDAQGTLTGKVSHKAEGYAAYEWRTDNNEDKDKFLNALTDKTWNVESVELVGLDNTDQTAAVHFQITTDHQATTAGDILYITPFKEDEIFGDLFKAGKRSYPIDMIIPQEEVLIFNLNIPDGYVVEQLPESKVISMAGNAARAILNFSGTAKQVQVLSRVMINRTYFAADEFEALRDFHQRVAAKQAELIVLKKI